jgi:hypothetical protein
LPLELLAILAMQRGTFETTRDGDDSSEDDEADAAPRNKALVVTHLGFNLQCDAFVTLSRGKLFPVELARFGTHHAFVYKKH